ncbi:MAG TPA: hypothetical protein VFN30_04965 [Chitinophagaceae bacterium]|nr:hypothetical protein [Chitinophagaceae bacterium]
MIPQYLYKISYAHEALLCKLYDYLFFDSRNGILQEKTGKHTTPDSIFLLIHFCTIGSDQLNRLNQQCKKENPNR